MRNTLFSRYYENQSSICRELFELTANNKIDWINLDMFIDHLELEGLAIDDIAWFHNYTKHLQATRHIPIADKTFFVCHNNRVFAISQSKYSRDIRFDFISDFGPLGTWRRIMESQSSLMQLHSLIQFVGTENQNENCKELLYSTGCILA